MILTNAINNFLERKAKKLSGISPNTISNYHYHLEALGRFMLKRRLNTKQWAEVQASREKLNQMISIIEVEQIIEDDIIDHLHEQKKSGVCENTLNIHLSTFSSFWTYLEKRHKIENVVKDIERANYKYQRQPSFSHEDLNTFMSYLESRKHKTKSTFRNHIFFSTLRYYGLRISEALNLDMPSIQLTEEGVTLNVMGKGNKPRSNTFPLFDEDNEIIKECQAYHQDLTYYINEIRPQYKVTDPTLSQYLFYSEKKNKWHPDSARWFFKKVMKELGLEENHYTPHSLRHAFVSHKLADGVPLITVSRLVGHASIDVISKIYAHSEETDRNIGMTKGFPRIPNKGKIA